MYLNDHWNVVTDKQEKIKLAPPITKVCPWVLNQPLLVDTKPAWCAYPFHIKPESLPLWPFCRSPQLWIGWSQQYPLRKPRKQLLPKVCCKSQVYSCLKSRNQSGKKYLCQMGSVLQTEMRLSKAPMVRQSRGIFRPNQSEMRSDWSCSVSRHWRKAANLRISAAPADSSLTSPPKAKLSPLKLCLRASMAEEMAAALVTEK